MRYHFWIGNHMSMVVSCGQWLNVIIFPKSPPSILPLFCSCAYPKATVEKTLGDCHWRMLYDVPRMLDLILHWGKPLIWVATVCVWGQWGKGALHVLVHWQPLLAIPKSSVWPLFFPAGVAHDCPVAQLLQIQRFLEE